MPRDLLKNPLWEAGDLGATLPDSEHAVSVCMPTWESVIGYEEGDPEVLAKFFTGYPRFCCHRYMEELFAKALEELGQEGERCLVFPRRSQAERCVVYVRERCGAEGRVAEFAGLGVALIPESAWQDAKRYWRLAGEIVSSRQARSVLDRGELDRSGDRGAEQAIREQLAELSGADAEDVYLFPTGMAAISTVHRMLVACFPERSKTAQCDFPYVDVLKVQEELGGEALFLPFQEDSDYDVLAGAAVSGQLRGIYGEFPSNPLLRCVDAQRLWEIGGMSDVPVVLDDTVGSVANIDVHPYADVVTTSLTKSFSGNGDVMAGCFILTKHCRYREKFREFLAESGDTGIWPCDAEVLQRNAVDYRERVARASQNALRLVEVLQEDARVRRVYYPTIESTDHFEAVRRDGGGHGPLLSIELADAGVAATFYDALKVSKGPSLGTNFTLACPYTLLAHYDELEWTESLGVPSHLVRVSVGLEDVEELIGRFQLALDKLVA